MSDQELRCDADLWKQMIEAHRSYVSARMAFLSRKKGATALLRMGLHNPSERAVSLDVISHLEDEQKKELFPDVLDLSSYAHGLTDLAIDTIMTLPRPWLLENIEPHAERLLGDGTDEQYRLILRIYSVLSLDLARQLAMQATKNLDPDIREVGEEFIQALGGATSDAA